MKANAGSVAAGLVAGLLLLAPATVGLARPGTGPSDGLAGVHGGGAGPVANFTAAINRLVELVGVAGSGILALVWARVALSWFSNDVSKKIQAKDRARDALIGSLLFTAAVTGLAWGLAHWVVTGT
ncbi:MAG TPA: hypothetical protein VML53_05715 [Thermoplasmata archaeon]|nr:hypothetical protein [Thermoplasmata archaeon]